MTMLRHTASWWLAATATVIALAGAMVALAVTADRAHGAFGDTFGILEVDPGTAPAFPGGRAVWAGTCDVSSDLVDPALGGGLRPSSVWKPISPYEGAAAHSTLVPAPSSPDQCIDSGHHVTGDSDVWVDGEGPAWRLAPVTQAGGHPDGTATMWFRRNLDRPFVPDGSVDNVYVNLPAGFVGDPTATPKCTAEQFAHKPIQCPPQTQVGVLRLQLSATGIKGQSNFGFENEEILPVYNLEPRRGNAAELGFANASNVDATTVRIVARARTNGDFGVATFAAQIPVSLPLLGQAITLWGTPWAASHDLWRAPEGFHPSEPDYEQPASEIPVDGLLPDDQRRYHSSWGPIRPFLSNPTECTGGPLSTQFLIDSYEDPGSFFDGFPDLGDVSWKRYDVGAPAVTGCEKNPFAPAASFAPSSTDADSASGLGVDITIPQNDDPPASIANNPDDETGAPAHWKSDAGLATAHLDKTVVRLAEGMSVNPSAAAGLEGCTDAQMGVREVGNPYLFNNSEPSCTAGSRIGTVNATTPLLEGSPNLTGDVFLGTPKSTDPTSGDMLRMFLVLRNEDRGLLAKIYGSATANPATGQLTATFDKNPRVPVENIHVDLKGGDRGLLALPQTCGQKSTGSQFTPWTAAHGAGGPVRDLIYNFTVGGDCAFGFAPTLAAGMSTGQARANGTLSFEFSRPQGQQWVQGLTASLPAGLLANVKNVSLCSNAQAATGACPAGSRIGTVDASAGSGSPFVLQKKGTAYLTQSYKGCAYGLAVVVPVVAGPFDGSSQATTLKDIVVRQRVCVDPTDAHVTVISDPLPLIHHGIPLRVRTIAVTVDRAKFMLNPSDCTPKQIVADFTSAQGTQSRQTAAFHTAGCRALPFRPKLALRLTGRKQTKTGKHPGLRAVVTQKRGQAGIKRAEVRLPKSLALDPDNAQALCEFEDGTKADLEKHCPKGSIVGRARAVSPLLNKPLRGNVYFVKNVRRGRTGNLIRTLPMIIAALRGEIAINLRGTTNVKRNTLVNTFANVPDAPVSRFNLNIKGGKNGILAVTRTRRARINICKGKHIAEADMDGHNGKRHDFNTRLKTPCKKAKRKGARRR